MRILTLLENHPNPNQHTLKAEHGVSFYIEVDGHVYLSDVGQSGKFAENAKILGVDLNKVEGLVISHHHYDHGGGLGYFFRENDHAKVYLRQLEDVEHVAEDPSGEIRTIGLDDALLHKHRERIVMVNETQEILPGLHVITDIPHSYAKPQGDQRLKIRFWGGLKPDPFTHELVTVVEDKNGLVILTGCAHNGVLNMITATQRALRDKPIQAVVGGFHLDHEDLQTVHSIGEALLKIDIPLVATGHCTGEEATDELARVLGSRLHRLYTGLELKF